MRIIKTEKAPAALGSYSQAILMNNIFFSSMQLGINAASGELASGFEAQCRTILLNLTEILNAGEMSMGEVVKVSVYLKDLDNFNIFNSIYSEYFTEPYPAREIVEVSALPKAAELGISITAMK